QRDDVSSERNRQTDAHENSSTFFQQTCDGLAQRFTSNIHYLRNPVDFGGPLRPADLYRFAVDCRGFRISFCTRQLFISATNIMSSEGQASPCGQLNCFGPRPDSPSIPKIFPSSVSL